MNPTDARACEGGEPTFVQTFIVNYLIVGWLVGLLILVHELGHFLAARWVKIPIARFSIGFGPKFWGVKGRKLAILNLLPIPPLDGGKICLHVLEKLHPKLARLHVPLGVAGWLFIPGLMVYATVLDIGRFIT